MLITDVLLESALLRVGQRYPLVSPRAAENDAPDAGAHESKMSMTGVQIADWITDCALAKRVQKPRTRVDAWLRPPIAEFECVLLHVASFVNCWERMT
jgi:hypothetical protein